MHEHYPPGTIAVATVRGVPDIRVMRTVDGWWLSFVKVDDDIYHATADLAEIRRLVVLNLHEANDTIPVSTVAEVAIQTLRKSPYLSDSRLATQIKAQVLLRPAEPTGLGAVVEVDGDVRFVRLPDGMWTSEDESQPWDNLNVVRVLSEGVAS